MSVLFRAAVDADPAFHALVIGVSHYRHIEGGGGPLCTNDLAAGLEQLDFAATAAARVATWLRDNFVSPTAGAGSIRLLLSPADGEKVGLPTDTVAATKANVEEAAAAWRRDIRADVDNVAIVFVAGHGIQTSEEGGVLLLEDFGNPLLPNPLSAALDVESVRRGAVADPNVAGTCTPGNQFYFFDACRSMLSGSSQYLTQPVGIASDVPRTSTRPRASWMCFAAGPLTAAYGDPERRSTLFSDVLVDCLEQRARAEDDGRTVQFSALQVALEEALQQAATENDVQQEASFGGTGRVIVPVHRRPPPDVAIEPRDEFSTNRGDSDGVGFRRVRFRTPSAVPVVLRRGRRTLDARPSEEPRRVRVDVDYDAVVPLPRGGELVVPFRVPPGSRSVSIEIDTPMNSILPPFRDHPPTDGLVRDADWSIRFLRWTGVEFAAARDLPTPRGVVDERSGQVVLTVGDGDHSVFPYTDAERTGTFAQIRSAGVTSDVFALPWGPTGKCDIVLSVGADRIHTSVTPGDAPAVELAADFLQHGRPDLALHTGLDTDDPAGRSALGFALRCTALLRSDDSARSLPVAQDLRRIYPAMADGAALEGAIIARQGETELARVVLDDALRQGLPVLTGSLSALAAEARAMHPFAPSMYLMREQRMMRLATRADYTKPWTTIRVGPDDRVRGRWWILGGHMEWRRAAIRP